MGAGVDRVLTGVGYPYLERDTLNQNWAAGDVSARKKVESILARPW
jgi:hypothetical protein